MSRVIAVLMVLLAGLAGTDAQSGATVTRARLLFTHQVPPTVEKLANVGSPWPNFLGQRLRLNLVNTFEMNDEQLRQVQVRQENIKQEQQSQLQQQHLQEEQRPQLQQQQQQEHLQQSQPQQFLLREIQQNENNKHSLLDQNRALSQSNNLQQTLERSLVQRPSNELQELQINHQNQQIQPNLSLLSQEIKPKLSSQGLNVQHTKQNFQQQELDNGFHQQNQIQQLNQAVHQPINPQQNQIQQISQDVQQTFIPQENRIQQLGQDVQQTFIPQQNQIQQLSQEVPQPFISQKNPFVNPIQSQGNMFSDFTAIEDPNLEFKDQFSQTPSKNNLVISEQQQPHIRTQQLDLKTLNHPNNVQLESQFQQQSNFENDPVIKQLSTDINFLDQQLFEMSQNFSQQGQGLNLFSDLSGKQTVQTFPFVHDQLQNLNELQNLNQQQNQKNRAHQQSSQLFDQQLTHIIQPSVSQVNSQLFVSNFDNKSSSTTQQSHQQQFNHEFGQQVPQFTTLLKGSDGFGQHPFSQVDIPFLNINNNQQHFDTSPDQLDINQQQFNPEFNQHHSQVNTPFLDVNNRQQQSDTSADQLNINQQQFNPEFNQHLSQVDTPFLEVNNQQQQFDTSADQLDKNQQQFTPEFNQQSIDISGQVLQQTPINQIHLVQDQLQTEQFDHVSDLKELHQNQQQQTPINDILRVEDQPQPEPFDHKSQLQESPQTQQQLLQLQPSTDKNHLQQSEGHKTDSRNEVPPGILAVFAAAGPPIKTRNSGK